MHVGNLIDQVIREKKMIKAQIAAEMNTSTQNFSGLLKRESVGIDKLQRLSEIVGYDFITHIANSKDENPNPNMVMEDPARYGLPRKKTISVMVELDGTSETLSYWVKRLPGLNAQV
jgi:hypothetical protein